MKKRLLVSILLLLTSQCNLAWAEDLDYQEILELDETELKEQSIEKGKEFIQEEAQKQEVSNQAKYLAQIRNEFPESIKLLFQDELNNDSLELYLNAYENIENLSLSKSVDYQIHVYNVHGHELGQLRAITNGQKLIQISPFLLIKTYNSKKPNIKVIEEKLQIIFKEEKQTSEPAGLKSQEIINSPKTQTVPAINNKRSIKVANISNRRVHIDINEPNGKAIGRGWTIDNDIYEAQFLNFESKPIELSNNAELRLTAEGLEPIITKTNELAIDERGNFTWLIEDLD